jgi:hypothetical protein
VDDARCADADLWLINTCTVKSPSQSAMDTVLRRGRAAGKALLVAGCVPQGDRRAVELRGLSLLGVTQIDRVVEAVEETLKGNTVRLLSKKALPRLDLPKVSALLVPGCWCRAAWPCWAAGAAAAPRRPHHCSTVAPWIAPVPSSRHTPLPAMLPAGAAQPAH